MGKLGVAVIRRKKGKIVDINMLESEKYMTSCLKISFIYAYMLNTLYLFNLSHFVWKSGKKESRDVKNKIQLLGVI